MEAILKDSVELSLKAIFERHRKTSLQLRKEPVINRKKRLKALREWIHKNRISLQEAAYKDLRKPSVEFDAIEVLYVLNEIKSALINLDGWTKPRQVDATLDMLGTRSWICYEPRGVCLIISPWNYPFSLCMGPMVSAIAAGNTAILKPSELTPNVSAEVARMASEVFDPAVVSVIGGDAEVSKALLKLPFDHIFFTGSPTVGKIVMKAAADHLASVTLELGGKCPALITRHARVEEAAQRIAVSKFVNNGQTCVAPDYVLVDEKIGTEFLNALTEQTKKLFTEKGQPFIESAHYARIINAKHFERLSDLVSDAIEKGAKIQLNGKHDRESRFFHPVILTDVPLEARVMQEEIFGPVLPVIFYPQLEKALAIINQLPKPLGLYLFSNSKKEQDKVLKETSSGTVCLNECAIQFLHPKLPFGGVNNSGMGKSHEYAGFLAFSNEKPVLKQKRGFTSVKIFYPPYTRTTRKLMDWFIKLFYR